MPGARRTRSLVCEMEGSIRAEVTTGLPKRSGIPCTMVERLLRALPGVPGLLASVANRSRRVEPAGLTLPLCLLDPSVGGSGPHGLTVRNDALRQARHQVHRIPRQRVVTIAKRPSW